MCCELIYGVLSPLHTRYHHYSLLVTFTPTAYCLSLIPSVRAAHYELTLTIHFLPPSTHGLLLMVCYSWYATPLTRGTTPHLLPHPTGCAQPTTALLSGTPQHPRAPPPAVRVLCACCNCFQFGLAGSCALMATRCLVASARQRREQQCARHLGSHMRRG